MKLSSAERSRRYARANPEKVKAASRKWAQAHPAKVKETKDRWRDKNRERVKEVARQWIEDHPEKPILYAARRRAVAKGIPFALSFTDIHVPDACPVLGIPLVQGVGVMGPNSPTLDRRVPDLGYVPGNIRVISALANRIKSDASVEQIEAVARWLRTEAPHAT